MSYFQPQTNDAGDDVMFLACNGDQEVLVISAPREACRHKVEAVPTLEANKVIVIVSETWIDSKLERAQTEEEAREVLAYVMARALRAGQEAFAQAGTETL